MNSACTRNLPKVIALPDAQRYARSTTKTGRIDHVNALPPKHEHRLGVA